VKRRYLLLIGVTAAAALAVAVWLSWPKPEVSEIAATAGPYRVRLIGAPPKVGVHPLTVEISGSAGESPEPESVSFQASLPQTGYTATPVIGVPDGPDRYVGKVALMTPGQWRIAVRIDGRPQPYTAVLEIPVKG
jgi:YtkA-like